MDPLHNPDSNPRFEKIDKVAMLARCPLFSGLSQWEIKSISQLMRLVEYKKDEAIYREGEEAVSFFVIVSGRYEASVSHLGKKKVLSYLRRGDYFGEMSLLTEEPHSATMRSLSDSLLLELKKDDFKKIVEHNAVVALEISRRLSSRLRGSDESTRLLLKSDVISVFSNQPHVGRTQFSINLAASLIRETHQKTVLLDMSPSGSEIAAKLHMAKKVPLTQFENIENESADAVARFIVAHPVGFDVLSVAHEEHDQVGERIIIPLLNHLSTEYRFILIDLPSYLDEMVMKALSQSDIVYCVTSSNINDITDIQEVIVDMEKTLSIQDDKVSIILNEVFMGVRTNFATKKELFGSRLTYSLPATPELKEHEESRLMPFVVDEPDAEYSRIIRHIARRMSNNLVGLVLGSGAALGLAHIGVLKVLEREKIPVDIIAGSSIGALIGSLYAVGKSSGEIEEAALEINSVWKLARLLDLSWYPVRGLLDGRKIMKHFGRHLGNKTFHDCRIPLKIVGANLSTRELTTYDTGLISEAVRVSIAIPSIFKPVFQRGEVMIDGGILSPLPIRTLQKAGANKIIAVNVFPTKRDIMERRIVMQEASEKEARLVERKHAIARGAYRLRKWLGRRFYPNVFDILMNTIQCMETEISEIEGESADILMRPVIPTASWVDFFKPQRFIRCGEEEAMKALPRIKALVSQQNV